MLELARAIPLQGLGLNSEITGKRIAKPELFQRERYGTCPFDLRRILAEVSDSFE
jgi:hypothetical protein